MGNVLGKFIGKLANGESVFKSLGENLSKVYNEQVTKFLIKGTDGSIRTINRTVVSKSDLVSNMAKRSYVPKSSWDKTHADDLGSRIITEFRPRSIVTNKYSIDGKAVKEHVLTLSKDGKMLDFQSLRTPTGGKNVYYNGKISGLYEAKNGEPFKNVSGVSPRKWISATEFSGSRFKV